MPTTEDVTGVKDAWDADDFELAPLTAEGEEPFVPNKLMAAEETAAALQAEAEDDEDLEPPVVLVDLAALSISSSSADDANSGALGSSLADSHAAVRERVLERLDADWHANLSELMAQGVCWHARRRESAARRLEHEAAHPGAVLTVVHYPSVVDGVRTGSLVEAVARPTPWEVCDELKAHIAQARRPLKWQAELSAELEELAEREAAWAEVMAALTAERDAAVAEKELTLARMHAAHKKPGAPPLTPADVTRMLAWLDELDARVAAAEEARVEMAEDDCGFIEPEPLAAGSGADAAAAAADAADGRSPPAPPSRSLLDIMLDVIFEQYPTPASISWAEHAVELSRAKSDLRRMWKSTFGRLPAASAIALKHAPKRAPPKPRAAGERPRMLVPAPPGAQRPPPSRPPPPSTSAPPPPPARDGGAAAEAIGMAIGHHGDSVGADTTKAGHWYQQQPAASPSADSAARWFG